MIIENYIRKLLIHKYNIKKYNIPDLFRLDKDRFKKFSFYFNGILFDFSNQYINQKTIDIFLSISKKKNLENKITDLFQKKQVNYTEKKQSLHTYIRDFQNLKSKNISYLKKMKLISKIFHESCYAVKGNKIKNIISIGIGGSSIGPILCCDSLSNQIKNRYKFYFLSGLDTKEILKILLYVNPKNTVCIINSKSFTTFEIQHNFSILKLWYMENGLNISNYFFAVTSFEKKAISCGIRKSHILEIDYNVGGRYSLTSAIGLVICIKIGYNNFVKLLDGFNLMDNHFRKTDLEKNIPFLMGCIGFWNNNINNYYGQTVIPYSSRLKKLLTYIQQLEMESNGKILKNKEDIVNYKTSPLIWGDIGTDCQHTFMQFLAQSNQVSPIDFILTLKNSHYATKTDEINVLSAFSQLKSLLKGGHDSHSVFYSPGNNPITTILLNEINPSIIGSLISSYEHKVYVQSLLWEINAFDQFGVDLGKKKFSTIKKIYKKNELNNFPKFIDHLAKYTKKFFL